MYENPLPFSFPCLDSGKTMYKTESLEDLDLGHAMLPKMRLLVSIYQHPQNSKNPQAHNL